MAEFDTISSAGIYACLTNPEKFDITVLETATSSNTVLKEKAADGAPQGCVIIAKEQTCGRGRFTRSFFSPPEGIYMSILLRPDILKTDAVLVTTAAAVAVCETIESLTDRKPEIKWVNDVLINGKKICGILSEASLNPKVKGFDYIIVGIGINVYPPSEGFNIEIKNTADALLQTPQNNFKNRFTAELLERFFGYYQKIEQKAHLEGYKKRCAVLGKEITVLKPEAYTAKALDIDDECRLLVEYPDSTKEYLYSGEISIKLT